MTSQKEKKRMIDYLVDNLKDSGVIIPQKKQLVPGIDSDIICVDDDKAILLVNQEYPTKYAKQANGKLKRDYDSFSKAYNALKTEKSQIAVLFYKDRETFYRNGFDFFAKTRYGKSIAEYINKEMAKSNEVRNKMIFLRPEEIFVNERKSWLQYYQPASEKLPEAIVSYQFSPASLTYKNPNLSRYSPEVRAKILSKIPEKADSKKLFVWNMREQLEGKLKVSERYDDSLAKLSSQPVKAPLGRGYLNLS